MINDEMVFYKWINGVVLAVNADDSASSEPGTTEIPMLQELAQQMKAVNDQLQAAECRQLTHTFKKEWKNWKNQAKSRSKVDAMEAKYESLTQQVRVGEFIDAQKLFLMTQQSWDKSRSAVGAKTTTMERESKAGVPLEEELGRLETQLDRVLNEITQEYCRLDLR